MRRIILVSTGMMLLPWLVFAGGQQEADFSIQFEDAGHQYISPTGEGVHDALKLSPVAIRGEDRAIRSYELTVYGASGDFDGQVVYQQVEKETRERGFFGRVFNVGDVPSLELPSELVWDGRFATGGEYDGDIVPDGDYLYQLRLTDNEGRSASTSPAQVTVDSEPPVLESLDASFSLFSPTGDGMRDVLVITARGSREYSWRGVFSDVDGTVVREYEQINTTGRIVNDQSPPRIEWDGTADDGSAVPDGVYSFTLFGSDRAGHVVAETIEAIEIDRDAEYFSLAVEYDVFSPVNTGVRDTITFNPQVFELEGLQSWRLDIRNSEDALIRRLSGDMPVPEAIEYDGRGSLSRPEDSGRPVLPEGRYTAELVVVHADGLEERSNQVDFEVDVTAPQVAVEPLRQVFNPKADGEESELRIRQTSSNVEFVWTGRILNRSRDTVRSFEWDGMVEDFSWDGMTDEGDIAADGLYSYVVETVDLAGNHASLEITGLRVDTITGDASVTFTPAAISPNDEQDFVEVQLDIDNADQVQSWLLEFIHLEQDRAARVRGEGSVPAHVGWDGRLDDDRVYDGEYLVRYTLAYPDDLEVAVAAEDHLIVDTRGPELTLDVTPDEFSPSPDMDDDQLTITLQAFDRLTRVEKWSLDVIDPQGNTFRSWEGEGEVDETIQWDARDEDGELVLSALEYMVVFRAEDSLGNQSMQTRDISTDVMVVRDGDILRINIPGIVFEPYADDLFERENQTLLRNIRTLQRLSDVLKSYPEYDILVEGHAVSLLYYNADTARREQRETLIPLSSRRAREIRKALGILGVELNRMTSVGRGGSDPLVPHDDLENRWKNRRVEVLMTR